MDSGTLIGRKFLSGIVLAARAPSYYKTIVRFEFDDLSEYQNENPAVENKLHVTRFS